MIARIRKALLAGFGASATGLIAAATQKGGMPGWPEIGACVGLGVAAALAVWGVPNGPTPPVGVTGQYVGGKQ